VEKFNFRFDNCKKASVIFMGDIHRGNANHNKDKFKRAIKQITDIDHQKK
jgi:DNA polymerase II small subunit/DNA polymerase delta subunit B